MKKKSANKVIREALSAYGLHQWQLADLLGIQESALSKKMRYELPEDEQKAILILIKSSAKKLKS